MQTLGRKEFFMKNIIPPEILATLKKESVSIKDIVDFLDKNQNITTSFLCKIIEIDPQKIYAYRSNQNKKRPKESFVDGVKPKASSKKSNRYKPEEKYELVNSYFAHDEEGKSRILREYGIYTSDIQRWEKQIKIAALEILGKRKTRSDKKSDEQLKIEALEKELKEQEKTTAKLSTLLILQKKTFQILKDRN